MLGGRAGDAGDDLAVRDAAEAAGDVLAHEPPVVAAHGEAAGWAVHQRRRPLHGVDLGHERGIHQPCLLEQPLPRGPRIVDAQPLDDGVVLAGEQRVQHRQPAPPVAVHPRQLLPRALLLELGVEGKQAALIQPQPPVLQPIAVRIPTQALHALPGGAVDLGAVPPMGLDVAEGWRFALVRSALARIAPGSEHAHTLRGPVIALRQRHLELTLAVVGTVAEPVVHHELDPRRRQQIQVRHRGELMPGQQSVGDLPRARFHQPVSGLGRTGAERHVATEPLPRAPHPVALAIIVAAVRHAPAVGVEVGREILRRPRLALGIGLGVDEVVLAQIHPVTEHHRHRDDHRKPVPHGETPHHPGENTEETVQQACHHRRPPIDAFFGRNFRYYSMKCNNAVRFAKALLHFHPIGQDLLGQGACANHALAQMQNEWITV